ncbi:hypothetical protein [Lentilitoribacter sp. Alg239-R112]|uniref:hypothetical protein n=1 Tax=Lentilitoribacter sp. Alg239-R112 TaxID=2305987 RepID=UPI0013A6E068|nr:hypothetical protein [Lentilitoribacter sp. Alg239-R112]
MTSISPWFRGYRRALRDVQHGIDQYVHSSTDTKKHIYFMVADEITMSLRDLKHKDSILRQLVHQREVHFRQEALTNIRSSDTSVPVEIPQQVLFYDGYRSGFADAITTAEDYKLRMNDPAARTAISSLVKRLKLAWKQKYQTSIKTNEIGSERTFSYVSITLAK